MLHFGLDVVTISMTKYNTEIEEKMVLYFSRLQEKDKRHYAAIEAEKLGHGGKFYIASLFNISRARIDRGINEILSPKVYEDIPIGKQRRAGGGRKKKS